MLALAVFNLRISREMVDFEVYRTAGRRAIAERGDRLGQAAKLWERTASEYPGAEQAPQALFLAGITRYRLADYVAAHSLFQQILAQVEEPGERAAAFFWMGKSQEVLGDTEAARAVWEQAASLDPTGYYSERARDVLTGQQPFTAPQDHDLSFDLGAERAEAEDWMRTIFDLPADMNLSDLGSLAQEPRFQRGNQLWRFGLYNEARAEFEDLRMSIEDDPADTYRLTNLIELGLYRSGILAARRVLTLAGMDDADCKPSLHVTHGDALPPCRNGPHKSSRPHLSFYLLTSPRLLSDRGREWPNTV